MAEEGVVEEKKEEQVTAQPEAPVTPPSQPTQSQEKASEVYVPSATEEKVSPGQAARAFIPKNLKEEKLLTDIQKATMGAENYKEQKELELKERKFKLAQAEAAAREKERMAIIREPVINSPQNIRAEQNLTRQEIENKQDVYVQRKKQLEDNKRALSAAKTNQIVNTAKQVVSGLASVGVPGVVAPAGPVASNGLEAQVVPAYAPNPVPQQPENYYTDTADRFRGVGGAVNSQSTDLVNAIGGGVSGSANPNILLELAGGSQGPAASSNQANANLLYQIGGGQNQPAPQEPVVIIQPQQPVPPPIERVMPAQQVQVPIQAAPVRPVVAPIRVIPRKITIPQVRTVEAPRVTRVPKVQKIYVPKPVYVPVEVKGNQERKVHHDHRGRPRARGRPSRRALAERIRRERLRLQG